ncbi:hypothetical protein FQN54_006305 [Arachnomyces sp. PD_36]|nr:hypothetical protein FQN54_006305 [Arachnomyces sp. PD_36]
MAANASTSRSPRSSRDSMLPVTEESRESSLSPLRSDIPDFKQGDTTPRSGGLARRTLGITLLLIVVVLWTASSFLASTLFADNTYSKPFFVTYVNTSFFVIPLVPAIAKRFYKLHRAGKLSQITSIRTLWRELDAPGRNEEEDGILKPDEEEESNDGYHQHHDGGAETSQDQSEEKLGLKATARLSLEFCMLWFLANYFAAACLQYTTVGSTTILTSTSGVWTLIFGAVVGVEKFTMKKLLGVLASLVGIILISSVDISGSEEDNRGSFPHKTPAEIALGDAMAAFSAIMYGIYTIVMKKRIGSESRVNMQLFFGLVGLFNTFLIWPGFLLLHFTNVERFALPPTERIWLIIVINSLTSLVSDICWAYAMLLTTPLVVTVGLSLTIPLSLIAQIFIQDHYSSPIYWVGAAVVFLSFVVVNHESKGEEEGSAGGAGGNSGGSGYAPISSDVDGGGGEGREEIELDDEEDMESRLSSSSDWGSGRRRGSG